MEQNIDAILINTEDNPEFPVLNKKLEKIINDNKKPAPREG